MIFSMNTESVAPEPQVSYRQVLASFHRAKTWQLGITFPAWFKAALPTQCIYTHVCLCRYTHVPRGTKQIGPTSLGGDKQAKVQFGISSLFFFKLLIKPFVLITAFSDSPKVCLPSCTSPAGSAPGPSAPVSADPLHPQQAYCTPQHMAYNPGSRWRLPGRRALAPATPVPCRPQFPGSSGVTLLTLINTLAARAVAWLPGEMAESERKPLSLNA